MNAPTRPVLRWHGGKWRLAPWILSHFPPHRIYVEPFGGAASVLLRKEPAITEIWNDLEGELVNLFAVLRSEPEGLAHQLRLTPYARDEYHALYEVGGTPVERARRFVSRSFMGQSSKGALRKSGFDTRINSDAFCGRLSCFKGVIDELPAYAARLSEVILESRPAPDVCRLYDRAETLFYLDPPYLGDHAKHYTHELAAEDHAELLAFLKTLAGMVVLSGYPSALYDDALQDWRRVETRALADGARARTEVLWINPAAADALDRVRRGHDSPLFAETGAAA